MLRQGVLATVAVALLFVWSAIGQASAEEGVADRAHTFISKMADDVLTQLTDPSVSAEEQERRFGKIVSEYIAFKSIARWVIGRRAWRVANKDQRETYFQLFAELMAATYAHRFQSYAGESLNIIAVSKIDDRQALVRSALKRPGGTKPLSVDWRVRETKGQLKVIDILIEGLSMAQTQRSEFKSFLKSKNGNVDALLSELETRISNARSAKNSETKQSAQTQ